MPWVGQFSIVGGEAREEGPAIGVFPDRARGETDPADLYLLVEPALPGSEEFCEQMVEVIGRLFYERRLSLTGGLLRALLGAHVHLREWNRKSLKEQWVAAGISALVLRGSEAYLAQVGPTLAYVRGDGQLLCLRPHIPDAQAPLGLHEEFWPAFTRWELAPGDSVFLASTNIAAIIDEDTVAEALARPADQVLPELYRQVRGLPDCAALLVALTPPEAAA